MISSPCDRRQPDNAPNTVREEVVDYLQINISFKFQIQHDRFLSWELQNMHAHTKARTIRKTSEQSNIHSSKGTL